MEEAKADAAQLKTLQGRLTAEQSAGSEAKLAAEKQKLENVKKEKAAIEKLAKAQKDEKAANVTEADQFRA